MYLLLHDLLNENIPLITYTERTKTVPMSFVFCDFSLLISLLLSMLHIIVYNSKTVETLFFTFHHLKELLFKCSGVNFLTEQTWFR